jgi:hypothetical protein
MMKAKQAEAKALVALNDKDQALKRAASILT